MDIPWAAILPLVVAAAAWIAFCIVDISRSEVQYLPRWAWMLISVLSVPIGGIVYFLVGKR
jgi:uncharacterized membrane protein